MTEQSELEKWANFNLQFGSDYPSRIQGALWLLEKARDKYTAIKDDCEFRADQASAEYLYGVRDLLSHLEQLCGRGSE